MIRPYRGVEPRIAASVYIDPSAQVIGDVEIGERSSIWPNAVLRGDVNSIRIGEETNVQDNSVVHVDVGEFVTVIGNRVTIGHRAVLHGCTVEDDCLIGIGAVVLNGAIIRRGAVVAAGSLVPEGAEIPAENLAIGIPARVRRPVSEEERRRFRANCAGYVETARSYKEGKQ